mmetsp:Transcript_38249/g.60560  ORF Transcript_38249/g.60560 Transcript_38249/m.60560 type:complete len:390 (-) Transcript_38249:128-1297(-)
MVGDLLGKLADVAMVLSMSSGLDHRVEDVERIDSNLVVLSDQFHMSNHRPEGGERVFHFDGLQKLDHVGLALLFSRSNFVQLLHISFELFFKDDQLMGQAFVVDLFELSNQLSINTDVLSHLNTIIEVVALVDETVDERHDDTLGRILSLLKEPLDLFDTAGLLLSIDGLVHLTQSIGELHVTVIGDVTESSQKLPDVPVCLGRDVIQTLNQGQSRTLGFVHGFDRLLTAIHQTTNTTHEITQKLNIGFNLFRLAQHSGELLEQRRYTSLIHKLNKPRDRLGGHLNTHTLHLFSGHGALQKSNVIGRVGLLLISHLGLLDQQPLVFERHHHHLSFFLSLDTHLLSQEIEKALHLLFGRHSRLSFLRGSHICSFNTFSLSFFFLQKHFSF